MKKHSVGFSQVLILFALLLLTLVSSTIVLKRLSNQAIGMDEFPINYLAAKNWLNENRSPYDLTNGEQITSLVNGEDHLETGRVVDYFRYPVLTTLFIMPFTFLSYVAAKALWMAINCILLISGSILLALSFRQKLPISILIATALFGVLNYYSLHSIITSSLKPLVFLIISLTLYLLCIHQDKFAGFILTIALIEFQMSVFVIIFFLIWAGINKRRYFIRSFWAGLIFELIISLILLPTWPVGWLQSLIMDVSNNGIYSSIISQIIKLSYSQGLWLNLGIHLSLLLGIIVLWITYRSTSRQHFLWVATLTMLISSLIVFPAKTGILILCIPALLMVIYTWMSRWFSYGRLFFWIATAVLFLSPWIAAIAGNLKASNEIFIILGLLYPIIGFIGLWWIRWWILKPDLSKIAD